MDRPSLDATDPSAPALSVHRRGRYPIRLVRGIVLLIAGIMAVGMTGCRSLYSDWIATRDRTLTPPPTRAEASPETDSEVLAASTLQKRWLSPHPTSGIDTKEPGPLARLFGATRPDPEDPEARRDLERAESAYRSGKLDAARPILKRLADRFRGTAIGERSRYLLAETQLRRGDLVAANDHYEALVLDYPTSVYLDEAVRREYQIADVWLRTVQPKNLEELLPYKAPQPEIELLPSISDGPRTRATGLLPPIDAGGHAERVFEHVRHHDPLGPLADDAVFRIAEFHYGRRDFQTAAYYYNQLLELHPKSDLAHAAQVGFVDSQVRDYRGAPYDRSGIDRAREMIRRNRVLFPERLVSADRLQETESWINDQQAERTYAIGQFYQGIGKVTSAEYYFAKVPRFWPDSPYAPKAREQLRTLAHLPRNEPSLPSKIETLPGAGLQPFQDSTGPGLNGDSAMSRGLPMMPGVGMGGLP